MTESFTITEPGEYVTSGGRKAVVLAVGLRGNFSVVGYVRGVDADTAEQWTPLGRSFNSGDGLNLDIVDRWSLYRGIPIDTPVWVKDEGDETWIARHFAGVDVNGKPQAWFSGCTSHTGGSDKTSLDLLSLTKPE